MDSPEEEFREEVRIRHIESQVKQVQIYAEEAEARAKLFRSVLNLVTMMNEKMLRLENDVEELKNAMKRDAC